MENQKMRKASSKKELRQMIGVSSSTITKILNIEYYEEIKKMGYKKNMRILPSAVVRFIINEYL